MKKIVKMTTIIVIFFMFCLKVSAGGYSDDQLASFDKIMPDGLSGITEDTDALIDSVGIGALVLEIKSIVERDGSAVLGFFLSCVGLCALMAVASAMSSRLARVATVGVGAIASLKIFHGISGLFSSVTDNLERLTDFFGSAIPIFTAVSVSSGAVGTASVQAVGMNFTLSLINDVGTAIMLFAVELGLVFAMLSFFGDERIGTLSSSVSSFFKWICGISATAIIATLSLQSVVSSAADTAAMRAAKYAASGIIPVVGGTVSGALSTLTSGLAYVRGVIGAGAVAAVVSIALSPLVMMLLYRAALSLSSSLCSLFAPDSAIKILVVYRAALDSLIAVYSLSSCVIIFEIILFMKSGVSVF